MNILKNRTVIGVFCIVVSLLICFVLTPLFNQSISAKTGIVRVVRDIKNGDEIKKDMVQVVQVGGYNLPDNVVTEQDMVIGKYAKADIYAGDYILTEKLSDTPAEENAYLYHLDGEKQAISVSIKNLAEGLSGKLVTGDIVSIIAPDYKKQGSTVIPPELNYVEVIGVTASSGYDTDTEENTGNAEEEKEKQLPATVTLLASIEQAKILAELEAEGSIHLTLAYRGSKENAEKFLSLQEQISNTLYQDVSQDVNKDTASDSMDTGMEKEEE
jgi:pilus assembly protein CpaB